MLIIAVLIILGCIFLIDILFNPKIDVNFETKDVLLHYTFKNERKWVVIWRN